MIPPRKLQPGALLRSKTNWDRLPMLLVIAVNELEITALETGPSRLSCWGLNYVTRYYERA
jgi:hypothetical protein